MALGQRDPYREIDYLDFHVREGAGEWAGREPVCPWEAKLYALE